MLTSKDILKLQIEETKNALAMAEQNLDYAEPEFVEAAIFEIYALRKKLSVLIRKMRGECA